MYKYGLACLCLCLLGCIQGVVEYVNEYAFVHVAVYGTSYLQSAKSTYTLFKSRGIYALVNDSLVANITTAACFFTGCLGMALGLLAFLWFHLVPQDHVPMIPSTFMAVMLGCVGFVAAWIPMRVVCGVLESSVQTVFVILAQHPHILHTTCPGLYQQIQSHYPESIQPI